jgi:hypothetical protein
VTLTPDARRQTIRSRQPRTLARGERSFGGRQVGASRPQVEAQTLVGRVREYLDKHYAANIPLDHLARMET